MTAQGKGIAKQSILLLGSRVSLHRMSTAPSDDRKRATTDAGSRPPCEARPLKSTVSITHEHRRHVGPALLSLQKHLTLNFARKEMAEAKHCGEPYRFSTLFTSSSDTSRILHHRDREIGLATIRKILHESRSGTPYTGCIQYRLGIQPHRRPTTTHTQPSTHDAHASIDRSSR